MPLPSVSEMADVIKAAFASEPSDEAENEGDARVETTEAITPAGARAIAPAPTKATESEPVQDAPTSQPSTEATPETPVTLFAKAVSEKGARAILDSLPEDVRELLGPELNKNWHRRLRERDNEIARLTATVEKVETSVAERIENFIDEMKTQGLSDEEKQAYLDRRELERYRSATRTKKAPSQEDVTAALAAHPVTAEFWGIIDDAGLPRDVDDARVKDVWAKAYTQQTPEDALAVMRAVAGTHKTLTKQPAAPAAPAKPAAFAAPAKSIEQLAAEMAERIVDEKLRKAGLLTNDTGRGSGPGAGRDANTYEFAKSETERILRGG